MSLRPFFVPMASAVIPPAIYGPAGFVLPAGPYDVTVNPGDNINTKFASCPTNGTIYVTGDPSVIYRPTGPLQMNSGVKVYGQGARISGCRTGMTWTASGARWTTPMSFRGTSDKQFTTMCYRNPPVGKSTNPGFVANGGYEDVFRDGVPVRRVASLAECTGDRWFYDVGAQLIYVGSNPAGHVMEVTQQNYGITSTSGGGQISGLVFEKFAAYGIKWGLNALISYCELRWNHLQGATSSESHVTFLRNYIHHNGMEGVTIDGGGGGFLFDTNDISFNNYLDFGNLSGGTTITEPFHIGGVKVINGTRTAVSTYTNNYVHDNNGHGLWWDFNYPGFPNWNGSDGPIEQVHDNVVVRQGACGLMYEVTGPGKMFANTIQGNGVRDGRATPYWASNGSSPDQPYTSGGWTNLGAQSGYNFVGNLGGVTGSSSYKLEITNNDFGSNHFGVYCVNQARENVPPPVSGNTIHDNRFHGDTNVSATGYSFTNNTA